MKRTRTLPKDTFKVKMGDPIMVDQAPSKPDEATPFPVTEGAKAWGRYRMPKVYRMPDGAMALTYSMSIDHYYDQGRTSPLFTSTDGGHAWKKAAWPHPGLENAMHPVISEVDGGQYYTITARNGINVSEHDMPERFDYGVGTMPFSGYRLADCPKGVRDWFADLNAMRWVPGDGPDSGWRKERPVWDHEGQFVWAYDDKPQNIRGEWGQSLYFEHPIIRMGGALYVADYWTTYLRPDGTPPDCWESHLMVSEDNARTWKRRSVIFSLDVSSCEPALALHGKDELVCVMRAESRDHNAYPNNMRITRSTDGGHTWAEPEAVHGYGVFPQLTVLENGIMALSYGRAPGTWLSFSPDGGRSWSEPAAVLDEAGKASSCGYTSLLPLGANEFIIAYGDIHRTDAEGKERKTILVRHVEVEG
ncbi:MAG: glycoside hydrolase [Oscillospiraceae bacterium]|nr:glycoside hydrolase [Oscillospiraceae bacterium]